eukprot:8889075-Pyramimonas_sp.AAC.1
MARKPFGILAHPAHGGLLSYPSLVRRGFEAEIDALGRERASKDAVLRFFAMYVARLHTYCMPGHEHVQPYYVLDVVHRATSFRKTMLEYDVCRADRHDFRLNSQT